MLSPNDYLYAFAYRNDVAEQLVRNYLKEFELSEARSETWRNLVVNDPAHIYRVYTLNPTGPGSILDALEYNGDEYRHVVFDVAGTITIPERWAYKSRNIVVHGNTSPGGICITGGTMAFIDCENLTFRHILWCLDEAPTLAQASSWNPVKVLSDDKTCRNITFDHCSILGGDDENDFGPLNHQNVKVPVSMENITVSHCIFGIGTRRWRGNHNFSLAVSYAKEVLIEGNLFAHNNRRNPQVYSPKNEQDRGGTILNNVIYNYGSMGIGVIFGTWDIINNCFYHGANSKPNAGFMPIKTTSSFEGPEDYSSLYLQDNRAYKRSGITLGTDWDIYGHEDDSQLIRRSGPDNYVRILPDDVVINVGTCFKHDIENLIKDQWAYRSGAWISTMADVGGVPQIPQRDRVFNLPNTIEELYNVNGLKP